MTCSCFIVPREALERLRDSGEVDAETRAAIDHTIEIDALQRKIRGLQASVMRKSTLLATSAPLTMLAAAPAVRVYDCKQTTVLPGNPVANPGSSADATAKRAHDITDDVAKFYATCFGRNSVDGGGGALNSSIHYDVKYNNAFWNGVQMVYGDGDGQVFIDFTGSDDVIGHELTHGVTQYTAALAYTNEAGGLNESMSDVFGTMFRQWRKTQDVKSADWLIGAGIMGPKAKAAGYTCLRDLSNPGAKHVLSKQPKHYSQYVPNGDPHLNSGIPNHAFYQAAMKLGGRSWEKLGKVWYNALTGGKTSKTMGFAKFASLTRAAAKALFASDPKVYAAVDGGWKAVGL